MNKYIEKVEVLVEALPYIKEFNGKTVVIKYGGSAMTNEKIQETIIQDITLMKLVGIKPIIVHGGGPEINNMLQLLGKEPQFINGLRVTDKETIDIVEMVLTGKINKNIVSKFQAQNIKSVGISGKDGMLTTATKKIVDNIDLGYVGEIEKINPQILYSLIENDFIPVISPIGCDNNGNTYNINADYVAIAIAESVNAEKLMFLTDVEGVLKDFNDKTSVISILTTDIIPSLINNKIIYGGMIPKVEACIKAINNGVKSVHIIDGRLEHSILLEIFTQAGVGTIIKEN